MIQPLSTVASRLAGGLLLALPLSAQVYPYRVMDLGVVPGTSPLAGVGAADISRDGDRVGGTSVWDPYVWERGQGMRALAKLPGYLNADLMGINAAGEAVGSCGLLTSGPNPLSAVHWNATGTPRAIAAFGTGTGGTWSVATAINDIGIVVGNASVAGAASHAFAWTVAGGRIDLTPGARSASALDINDAGQICLVVDGMPVRLDPGGRRLSLGGIVAERINERGQMVGTDGQGTLVRYTDGIGWQGVAKGGPAMREVGDINGFGQIVATQWVRVGISPPRYDRYGHIYSPGLGIRRLDDWLDPAAQVRVWTVSGIAEDGTIAAEGSIGSVNRALVLEPRFFTTYGNGCAGSGGVVPRIIAAGEPAGRGRIALLVADGPPTGAGILLISTAPSATPLAGCALLIDMAAGAAFGLGLNGVGQGHLAFDLPQRTARSSLFAQFGALDPGAANGAFALSNGVRVDLQ